MLTRLEEGNASEGAIGNNTSIVPGLRAVCNRIRLRQISGFSIKPPFDGWSYLGVSNRLETRGCEDTEILETDERCSKLETAIDLHQQNSLKQASPRLSG